MFHYTVTTEKSIEEAIAQLDAHLKEEQFGILWQLNVQEKLTEKGIEWQQPYRILEVCQPQKAKSILTENHLAGYFLPCKIVVYEDGGQTKIGMPKITALFHMIDGERLQAIASDVEKRLIACINKSK